VDDCPPAGSILHVPDSYQSIIAAAHDIIARGMKLDTTDSFRVPLKAQNTGTCPDVPHLDRFILRAGQENILKWMDRQRKHKVLVS
jgi:hypothetical protein